MAIEYGSQKTVGDTHFMIAVENLTVLFRIPIVEEAFYTIFMDGEIAKCFHQTQKLSRYSIVLWPKYLSLIRFKIVVLYVFGGGGGSNMG